MRAILPYLSGILIFVAAAAFIVPKVMGHSSSTRIAPDKSNEATLAACLHQFRLDCGRYPTTKEGLQALIQAPPALRHQAKEPYLTVGPLPLDSWGHPYAYLSPEVDGRPDTFTITSYGSDGVPGGADGTEAADIVDTE